MLLKYSELHKQNTGTVNTTALKLYFQRIFSANFIWQILSAYIITETERLTMFKFSGLFAMLWKTSKSKGSVYKQKQDYTEYQYIG